MAKILVIDDDQQVLDVLSSYLQAAGHEPVRASDGRAGIRLLSTERFDVVITDIIMPEQDGLEVLMWLKGMSDRPKVIAMSGGSAGLDLNLLLGVSKSMSADRILPKPVNYATLSRAVAELLGDSD